MASCRPRLYPEQRRLFSTVLLAHDPLNHHWPVLRGVCGALVSAGAAYSYARVHSERVEQRSGRSEPQKLEYASVAVMQDALRELRGILRDDAVSTDDDTLEAHGYSPWSTVNSDVLPVAVVFPRSTEEVVEIVRICGRYKVPMTPFSGGTSLEGNFSTPHGGISIDFMEMDRILEFHPDDMDVVVQPAVDWAILNEVIQESRLFFPVDPGPSARIGGMVGTNCSGTNAVRYGPMKDWVINLTVVLASGETIKTRRRPRKTAAGYDLTSLFVGSEGTLGIVTEVTLKLAVVPEEIRVAVATFPTIRAAAAAASAVMRSGLPVAALEIMDDKQMDIINRSQMTNRTWTVKPTLFLKFSGTKLGIQENITQAQAIASKNRSGNFVFADSVQETEDLWSARKQALWSMLRVMRKDGEAEQSVWSTDVAVPLSRLAEIIEISKAELEELGIFASILGHVGDGNFHESILYDKRNPASVEQIQQCVSRLVDRALKMEGTCTGEHGVGMGKKKYLVQELGTPTVNVMKSIKSSLDPDWLMNPGKIIDAPA